MCVWHVEFHLSEPIKQIVHNSTTIHARVLKMIIPQFRKSGFTVNLLPENRCAMHVSHPRESAMTFFMLQHPGIADQCTIERIV
jgi:hypothetical protein